MNRTTPVPFVRSNFQLERGKHTPLPTTYWKIFDAFHWAHRVWGYDRLVRTYTNPNNLTKLVAGHVLDFAAGNTLVVRVAAQCVVVATRTLECIDQLKLVERHFTKLKYALQGHYSYHKPIKWDVGNKKSRTFSLSTTLYWNEKRDMLAQRVSRITKHLFLFIRESFKLSMLMVDLYRAFSLDPADTRQGVREVFVNSAKLMDRLVDNQELLLEGLQKRRPVIKKIFEKVGSSYTPDAFITFVSTKMKKTTKKYTVVKKFTHWTDHVLLELAKTGAFTVSAGFGLDRFFPTRFIPQKTLDSLEPKKKKPVEGPRFFTGTVDPKLIT